MQRKNLYISLSSLFLMALCTPAAAFAETLRFDGFETYPTGSVNGRGDTWYVQPGDIFGGGAGGDVVTSPTHSGNHALRFGVAWDLMLGWFRVRWDNDTGDDFGGAVDMSWWIDPLVTDWGRPWEIQVDGWYFDNGVRTAKVASLTTRAGTSQTLLDVSTSGGWMELPAAIPNNTWSEVFLKIDFSANPDVYSVRVGNTGTWWGPFTLNANTDYFRSLRFTAEARGANYFYVDDIVITPEPATVSLLASGLLCSLLFTCVWRNRRGRVACSQEVQRRGSVFRRMTSLPRLRR